MKRSLVKQGDVLLNITGASIGRVALFDLTDVRANVNQHVCIIRPKPDTVAARYLTYLISSPDFQSEREFARRVAAVEKINAMHRAALGELDALFASLQHRAFRGEL